MSLQLKKAGSLLNIICRSSYKDCTSFVENLDDKGIELICKLIYYIVSGDLALDSNSHARLKKKIKKDITDVKKLFLIPKNPHDIKKKKKILQKKKIVGILTAIATATTPIINRLVAKHL